MEQLLFTNEKLTPEWLRQSKHVQCSLGEMFESALIVGICNFLRNRNCLFNVVVQVRSKNVQIAESLA